MRPEGARHGFVVARRSAHDSLAHPGGRVRFWHVARIVAGENMERSSFFIWVAGLCLACGSPRDPEPGVAEETTPIAHAGAPASAEDLRASCGDSVCDIGEDCSRCQVDCGACRASVELWLTEPHPDADVALHATTLGGLEQALLADFDAAERTILVAVYDLSRPAIFDGLGRALTRGVEVRIVTECENRTGHRARLLDELEAEGALVKDDRSSFGGLNDACPEDGGEMHHKFVVVDGQTVWAGSANFTPTDLNYNRNHAFRFVNEDVAAAFGEEWDDLWAGRFGRSKGSRSARSFDLGRVSVTLGFSPRRIADEDLRSVTRELVLAALEEASSSVELALFSLTDPGVGERLELASPFLRGVVDATQADGRSSRVRGLCQAGARLVVENLPGKVHHKLAALDAAGQDPTLVGGSTNWSLGGFDENDETLIVVVDPALAAAGAAAIQRLLDDPAHMGGECCFHSAEGYDAWSTLCGDQPCVCKNGLDDDFDGRTDERDSDCAAPLSCRP